jgi:hypothetical protein
MEPADLVVTLVAAYRPQVERRLAAAGIDPPSGIHEALVDGEIWLREALEDLLASPFARQSRGPLEVFQEAMRFPTEVLSSAGVPEVPRDPAAAAALPGDRYHLAPASSRDLGEEVWQAHLSWGMRKARAVVRPAVGLLSDDLMDRERIERAVKQSGYRLESWRASPQPGDRLPSVAFADLAHPDVDETIRLLAGSGVRVIAFGPHVDDLAMVRARALGAADALARSRFFGAIPDLLPDIV